MTPSERAALHTQHCLVRAREVIEALTHSATATAPSRTPRPLTAQPRIIQSVKARPKQSVAQSLKQSVSNQVSNHKAHPANDPSNDPSIYNTPDSMDAARHAVLALALPNDKHAMFVALMQYHNAVLAHSRLSK